MYKYSNQDVINEADLILAGYTLDRASAQLCIPISTISWHLCYKLFDIDFIKWIDVRERLDKYAKNKQRVIDNKSKIEQIPVQIVR